MGDFYIFSCIFQKFVVPLHKISRLERRSNDSQTTVVPEGKGPSAIELNKK